MRSRRFLYPLPTMATTRAKKEQVLKELTEHFKNAKSVVVTRNGGLTVASVEKIRKTMEKERLVYTVAKKTLIERAAKDAGVAEIPSAIMEGPISLTFGFEDEVAGARIVKALNKEDEKFIPVGGMVGSRILAKAELLALASLPTRLELIAQFIGRLNGPISRFTRVVVGPARGFTTALKAYAEKRQSAAV